MIALIIILTIIVGFMVLVITNIHIVPQSNEYVIERLGTYICTWKAGLHFKIPFIDKIVNKISLKENVMDFPPQPVITKDNVTMQIDTVVYLKISDSKLFTYGVNKPDLAIENLAITTLRNIVGDLELDATLTSRENINAKMSKFLDEATDAWGIKVTRVEIKSIMPPKEIQDSMEKQMKAERERRAKILEAEGQKRSSILIAEGDKESAILRAEATKQSKIKEAEGEAEALLSVQNAYADSLKILCSVELTEEILKLKAMETLRDLGDGNATKLIVPSDIASVGGLLATLKATANVEDETDKGKKNKKRIKVQSEEMQQSLPI